VDYLEYFAADPQTRIIGAYLEGVREGRRLFQLLREIAPAKPVAVWKGGRTSVGAEAAASHTGSLASPDVVWTSLLRQAGVIKVSSLEELADVLLALQHLGRFRGRRVALISGLTGGGGGDSVAGADSCASVGLEVPPFSAAVRSSLACFLPAAGSILRNPLDMGSIGHRPEILEKTLSLVLAEPQIDAVIVQEHIENMLAFLSPEEVQATNEVIIRFRAEQPKPILVVSTPESPEARQWEFEDRLAAGGVPVFPTLERAARALADLNQLSPAE
jgi:acyl-CoA synthetase (NDP forming)